MKNIDVPIGTVLPITDAFFMRLLTADYINGDKVLIYVEEEGGRGLQCRHVARLHAPVRPCHEAL